MINNKSVLDLQVMADAMTNFSPTPTDPLFNKAVQNYDFTGAQTALNDAQFGASTQTLHALAGLQGGAVTL